MTLSREEKIARLRLWRTPKIGPATYRTLMTRFGSALDTLERLPEQVRAAGRPVPKFPEAGKIIAEIEALHKLGGRFIFSGAPEFPDILTHIPDAPPILAALGRLELLQRPSIAIVGSRNASLNGKNLTHLYAQALGQAGFVITSGMAKGIDAAAHHAALATGTLAIVAGGIDVIYPRENKGLYDQIAEQGLILAEQPLHMPTSARLFPLRNRLVSGLSKGTLVVEANARSGSLITARLAAEQGREVFAVPGSPLEGRAAGTNDLIKQGATLVTRVEDILDVFDILPVALSQPPIAPMPAPSTGRSSQPPIASQPLAPADAVSWSPAPQPPPSTARSPQPPIVSQPQPPVASAASSADSASQVPASPLSQSPTSPQSQSPASPPSQSPDSNRSQPSARPSPQAKPVSQDLSALKKRILENLSHAPVPIDDLTAECEGTAAQMQPVLADMEIAGLINRHPGGLISLAA